MSQLEDSEAADKAYRTVTLTILPPAILCYFLAALDRNTVAFVAIDLQRDLGLTAVQVGLGATLFFLSYTALEVPSSLGLARFGARRWIARIMLSWGIVTAITAFATGPLSFMSLRVLLGAAEAGLYPAIVFLIASWFPFDRRSGALSIWLAACSFSSFVAAPLSGTILSIVGNAQGLHPWQWLFLISGVATVLTSFLVIRIMPSNPAEAKRLPQEVRARVAQDFAQDAITQAKPSHSPFASIFEPRLVLASVAYMGIVTVSYAINFWTPSVVREGGLSTFETGFVVALPFGLSAIAMLLWSRLTRRGMNPYVAVMAPLILAGGSLALCAATSSYGVLLTGLCLVSIGIGAAVPVFWALVSGLTATSGQPTSLALVNSVGNLGGMAGPLLMGWTKQNSGSYAGGFAILGVILLASLILLGYLKIAAGRRQGKSV